jgi:predicted MPP superfamily phosphohydrolase
LKAWPLLAIAIVQSFLWIAHWFLYRTWVDFWWPMSPQELLMLRIALGILATIFLAASLIGFRFSNPGVRLLYWLASLWLGLANFLFVGALIAWLADLLLRFTVSAPARAAGRHYIAGVLLAAAVAGAVYGIVNARFVRIRRVSVQMPNLPQCWRERKALLITDTHLGHINGRGFAKHLADIARKLDPAVIFLAGDLFDGAKVNPRQIAGPILDLHPPLGTFFVDGNHEEFGGAAHFEEALRAAGIRVLHNECVTIDGVHIVGVPYGPTANQLQMRAFLEGLHLKNSQPSILLNHVPNKLPLAEHAGISLQLSGHTHGGGQMFPFTLITRRAFGKFSYGLQRFGDMQVYTSSGAGTWGPPMRVGTQSEIVLLTFE